ncbi:riboflavin biosynthesis protein RibF [Fructobacillus sp. M1-13]|uniref:Riboflavin biosynthesis protein n=1 Tax=Fructobacillus papyriferae TaxID=2713171 RepID=A0ABS5QP14_9LACO|nr:riboflavin biosynthesis protein RibF [Fructobacillus papyriferae]MBS9334612.1 riboflavin biosynthesis protein RibF [Fructobacillus papyriferae]MCD2158602.1 riboflavin biosynthesis protein RibF [Fructobacillus papyriferae]
MTTLYKIHYPLDNHFEQASPQVLAMGYFDGVHLGHQAVIKEAKKQADALGLPLAVLTYAPYPGLVFDKQPLPWHDLTPIDQKVALLGELGVDRVYCLNLTSTLASLSPVDFVEKVLLVLQAKVVVAGFDHLYGPKERQADMAHLPEYANGRFDVTVVEKQKIAGGSDKIASRAIRIDLANGHLEAVTNSLGRPHRTSGVVVHGDARGRTLGYPTINIWTPENESLPGIGVYVVRVQIAGRQVRGMASIGRNVTFEKNRPVTVEINLFDFDQQVYGEEVTVDWLHYLRGEVAFESVEDLIQQLECDRADSQQYFLEN